MQGRVEMKLSVSVTSYSWPEHEIGSRLAQLAGFLDPLRDCDWARW
jgi:hypothetical protein